MFKANKLGALALIGSTAVLAAGSASAAAIDVTAVTAAISDTLTPVGLIGAGVLLVLVAVKTYKWIRRAM
jgi:hypothetical protein